MNGIRNIAIIAHVDHGKTTLVDEILKQSGTYKSHGELTERVMDSNDLEKERGITILSKNTGIYYKDEKINIVDTPGHADFGGEVERVLSMVDGVLLVVDAYEGPMPQTRFVLQKALAGGLKPIVVVNKIDRENSDPTEAVNKVFDLFIDLNASEEQIDFPIVYASAKQGFAKLSLDDPEENILPLLDVIMANIKPYEVVKDLPFQMLISNVVGDEYLGKMCLGKIKQGFPKKGQSVVVVGPNGERRGKIGKIFSSLGLDRTEVEFGQPGDIITLSGLSESNIGETICDADHVEALDFVPIDSPTVSMTFSVNNSPKGGTEGDFVTSRQIRERLFKEMETNLSLLVEETDVKESFSVSGRGELHLSILIETMRREGFELLVSKPKIIYKTENGKVMEPVEDLYIDVPEEFVGTVMEKMGTRKGQLVNMGTSDNGYSRLEFVIPARGLIGYRGEFLTDTKGNGILNHSFRGYEEKKGDISPRSKGVIVAFETGTTTDYGLFNAQDKGTLFVGNGVEVYEGMVVGEASRGEDIAINVCKQKALTNMRASGSDESIKIVPHKTLSLEESIDFIDDDELVEVTPTKLRIRKQILDSNERAKFDNKRRKQKQAQM